MRSRRRAVALADPHLAREQQRLGPGARLREAALDEELVEADAVAPWSWACAYRGTAGSPRTSAGRPAGISSGRPPPP